MIEKIVRSINGKNEWDDIDMLIINLYNVEFIVDFGPFRKGDKCEILTVDYNKGELVQHDKEGYIIKSVHVEMKPIIMA